MKKGLRWKIILTLAVLALCLYLSYPINKKIKRGLDLEGGLHLRLQVVTEDAVTAETDNAILRLQEQYKKNSVTYTSIVKDGSGKISINGLNSDQEGKIKDAFDTFLRDWDYSFLGVSIRATLKTAVVQFLKDQAVDQSIETIRNRVDRFGVAEPVIQKYGADSIIVQFPGVDNPEHIQDIIKTRAQLEFKLVKAGPTETEEALLTDFGGKVPEDAQLLKGDPKRGKGGFYLVSKVAAITGKDLRTIRRSPDEWGQPQVAFTLNADGSARFGQVTGDNIGKPLAIILDDKIQSAPRIDAKITDSGVIHGNFTVEEADDLVLVLKAGSLPAGIKTLENRTIGPSLGADSIRAGMLSFLIAVLSVIIFMIVYYRLSGINAIAALILNIIILLGSLAYFQATLTLPGIAGIILGVGMSVDANVLIFERMREELASGKSILSSISLGFSRAFTAIFDSNVTTIISAVFLFQFGTGPIKGYAVTLIISLVANMFTAVFVSHLLFDLTHDKNTKKLSI